MLRVFTPVRVALGLAAAAVIAFAVLWFTPSDQYLLLPDKAHPVAPLISVKGGKEPTGPGGIYFVDVLVRKANLLESFFPGIHEGSSLLPAAAINPPGVSESARIQEDQQEMQRSQQIAAAVALTALGYKVTAKPTGVLIEQVAGNAPAAGKLQPTDVVVAVDGKPVRTPAELRALIRLHKPGETVRLSVRRATGLRQVVVKTIADPNDPSLPIIGVIVTQAAQIKLPVKVSIDAGGVGGPSAGLAFALGLMQELGRNVDHGYKVAATGEIGLDGSVSAIGGVEQKTFDARRAKVDVFLVPAGDNAKEARRFAHGLRIVAVQSFAQALHALATLSAKR